MCKMLKFLACFILVLSFASIASAELLVHYKFDETADTVAVDASGNGLDGAINGTPSWVEGTLDGALQFSGTENVIIPAEGMDMYSDIGSVAFWMLKSDEPAGINTIFWGGDNLTGGGFGPENEMHVHIEQAVTDVWVGGEICFFTIGDPNIHLHSDPDKGGADAPGNVPVNPYLVADDEWHHIAAIWDGDNGIAKLYIDGLLIMEWEYETTGFALTNMFLGQMASASRTYIGVLDDFRLYSNALSEEEVVALYNNEPSLVNDNPVAKPQEFTLNQNYPNPFNPTTTISYQLAKDSDVLLTIYNETGQKVRTLVQEKQASGFQSINWDGSDDAGQPLSSGIYLYRLQVDNKVQTRKLMLVK